MSRQQKFRLAIPFDENQRALLNIWLERFLQSAVHLWSTPSIDDRHLFIHPADFPNLLSCAQVEDCTELEFYRIRRIGANVIAKSLGKRARFHSLLKEMVVNWLDGLSPSREIMPSHSEGDADTILIDGIE